MELIRCPRCAREIPEESRFCRRCGSAITWHLQPSPTLTWGSTPPAASSVSFSRSSAVVEKEKSKTIDPAPIRRSGGAGMFAVFAAAGLFFFVNYHVAVRPLMSPTPARVMPATPYTTPPLMFHSSTLRPPSPNLPALPPPPPPGTRMWLTEPTPASRDRYDSAHWRTYTGNHPAPSNQRR